MAGRNISVDRQKLFNLFAAIDDVLLPGGNDPKLLAKLRQAASAVCQNVGKLHQPEKPPRKGA